jgi:hypothetical protein
VYTSTPTRELSTTKGVKQQPLILSIKDQIVTPYLRSKQMEYYIKTPKKRPTF